MSHTLQRLDDGLLGNTISNNDIDFQLQQWNVRIYVVEWLWTHAVSHTIALTLKMVGIWLSSCIETYLYAQRITFNVHHLSKIYTHTHTHKMTKKRATFAMDNRIRENKTNKKKQILYMMQTSVAFAQRESASDVTVVWAEDNCIQTRMVWEF